MSVHDQLNRLVDLGMAIPDREQAAHSLRHIGCHRLSSYWQPFQAQPADNSDPVFREGVTFGDVIERYDFDWHLRSLLTDALGHIEVSVRSQWVRHLASAPDGGDLAHLNRNLFAAQRYTENLAELERSYRKIARQDNRSWQVIPIWEVSEAMSFGQLSKWYNTILARSIRSAISGHYHVNHKILSSLLYNMTHLRNICAHHHRLWNLNLQPGLQIPRALSMHCNRDDNDKLYNRLVIVAYLMSMISPGALWRKRMLTLLNEYPRIPKDRMGFPDNWREMEFWRR